MAEEKRTRTITWEDPQQGAQAAKSMSGLAYLQSIIDGQNPTAPIGQALGFEPVSVEDGKAVFAVVPAEYHYNPIGLVHGGLVCTLCDSAMGCAVHTKLKEGLSYTTLEIKVNMVRPITAKTGRLTCTGTVIHVGRSVATAEARVEDEQGRLYAHATTTCMIFNS
ncbi:PaaI family thioesterase [Tellurirhabdus rosea]|uniref:PaaI family thioesterase n=1 Tax=Tellurirhabdus rosea TaxID=2674997 RepID=UPI002256AE5E|nr:PaaI family thioesterase [Tellurirhabdus rosea]